MEGLELIDIKERALVYSILERYNLNVITIEKFDNKYKVVTNNKVFWLNSINRGRDKIISSDLVIEELVKHEFKNTLKYIRSKYKELYIRKKKNLYYITEHIEGEQFNLNNFEEAIEGIKLLGSFHKAARNIEIDKINLKRNMKNWSNIFNKNLSDLERFKTLIERKRIKTEFDAIYYKHIEYFYKLGLLSINLLNKYDFNGVVNKSKSSSTLCLDGLSKKYLLKVHGAYYLTSLEPLEINYYINDVSKYIRSIMNKPNSEWDFYKVKTLIEAYDEINSINKQEAGILLGLLIFPYKFCKLGKTRYIKHKNWDENRYKSKVEKLIKNKEKKEGFIDAYINNLENI